MHWTLIGPVFEQDGEQDGETTTNNFWVISNIQKCEREKLDSKPAFSLRSVTEVMDEKQDTDQQVETFAGSALLGLAGKDSYDGRRKLFEYERLLLEMLISYGAPIDSLDEEGKTSLYYSCVNGVPETFKLLVELGADYTLMFDPFPSGEIDNPPSVVPEGHQKSNLLQIALNARQWEPFRVYGRMEQRGGIRLWYTFLMLACIAHRTTQLWSSFFMLLAIKAISLMFGSCSTMAWIMPRELDEVVIEIMSLGAPFTSQQWWVRQTWLYACKTMELTLVRSTHVHRHWGERRFWWRQLNQHSNFGR
jgi:hypothetical protein